MDFHLPSQNIKMCNKDHCLLNVKCKLVTKCGVQRVLIFNPSKLLCTGNVLEVVSPAGCSTNKAVLSVRGVTCRDNKMSVFVT